MILGDLDGAIGGTLAENMEGTFELAGTLALVLVRLGVPLVKMNCAGGQPG